MRFLEMRFWLEWGIERLQTRRPLSTHLPLVMLGRTFLVVFSDTVWSLSSNKHPPK